MAYATRTEVLQRMGHASATDTALLARIDDALGAATSAIELVTSRVFTQADDTVRTFAVPDRYCNVLEIPDFRSINTLKLDDDDDGVFEVTVTAYEADVIVDRNQDGWPYETVRLLSRHFPWGGRRRRRIEIDANWGWAAVPADINMACSLLAARLAQRSESAIFGTESFGELGAASIRKTDPDVAMMVGKYVKPSVA